jgi:IS30 family transposase
MDLFPDIKKEKEWTKLTYEERLQIKKMLDLGYSRTRICQAMDRSYNTIHFDIKRNGGKENYNPKKANDEAIIRMSQPNAKTIRGLEELLRVKIDSLQMQLDILTQQIRNKNDTKN